MSLFKVFLVDDEYKAIVRLRELLTHVRCVEVIGFATSFKEALTGIQSTHPDIVFMDIEIRERSGFEVVKAINREGIFPRIIFATGHNQYAIKALRSKAIDYLLKPIDLEELQEAIQRITDNDGQKIRDLIHKALHEQQLSERESQILERVCKGSSSQEISEELYLSVHTIDTYRRKLLKRFNARNTQELMSFLIQSLLHQD